MQKARNHPERIIGLSLLVGTRFQVLLTPLPGFFSPFSHPTTALSVAREYSGLEGGPPSFIPGFPCPVLLRILAIRFYHAYGTLTLYGRLFQAVLLRIHGIMQVLQPRWPRDHRFGLIPVRSPLLRESLLLSFPAGTEMFHFPAFARTAYLFSCT